ncbi:MAG TPA: glutaredoxin family protein [Chthoniobacterales bacterium]|jgi:glutaredoxin|nr:glutaredoxin family protein [Chthoniobacterales bacterium]
MVSNRLILYVKPGCSWCRRAENYLREHGYSYVLVDVINDRSAFAEMKRLSGQTYAPTLAVGDLILADFGPEELEEFLQQHQLLP